MILTVKMEWIFKTATVYTIPCHDTGHINVMLVLQICVDSVYILPGSSSQTFPASSDGTYDVSNIEVETDIVAIEESFIAINKETDTGIKQVEIPEDKTFPDIKTEPDEVSYVCICLLLDTFHHCQEISVVFVMLVYLAIWYSYYTDWATWPTQFCRWSSFGKRVWFTESHIVLIILFVLVVFFTQFILDIK